MSAPKPELTKPKDVNRAVSGQNRDGAARLERAAAAILMKYRRRWTIIRLLDALLRPLAWFSKPNPPSDLDEIERILVFDHGNLGDIVLLAPFLHSLRARFPKAHIAVLGKSSIKSLLLNQNLADELIPVRVPWAEHLSRWRRYNPFSPLWMGLFRDVVRLRKRAFDVAFVAGKGDIRHNLILWLTGAKRRVGYAFAGGGSLLTDIVEPDLANLHQANLSLGLLERIGVPSTSNGSILRVSSDDEILAVKFLAERGIHGADLVVGIHPGARIPIRQWGEVRFMEIAHWIVERFGAKVIWFTDPAQLSSCPTGLGIISVSLPLKQFLAVLSRCQLVVCNESGPMHMAAGLGVPVVAVFGPQEPSRFGPLGDRHQVVVRQDVWCRPCGDRCIFGEPYCLALIPPEHVMQAVERAIEGIGKSVTAAAVFDVPKANTQ